MTDPGLAFAELTEVAALLHAKTVSPVELVQSMLGRIAAVDGRLGSYQHVMAASALAEARQAETEIARGKIRGPLHGVPVAVKDLCWTADAPTLAGMPINRDFVAPEDGTVVRRLREAGAVLLGKLVMTEGAYAGYHPTMKPAINPWDAVAWTGSSSSGSGVATAAGLCYGAIGSDTGGSIRLPCAANGVTGIKPTWGRVSRHGAFELAATLDHLGPMTRSARDAAAVLGAIAGVDPKDPTTLRTPVPDYLAGIDGGVAGLRIGIAPAYMALGMDAPTGLAIDAARASLANLGGVITDVLFPDAEQILADWFSQCAVETRVAHEKTFPSRRAEYGPVLTSFIELSREVSAADMQKMALRRLDFRGRVEALFETIDLLLLPVQGIAGPSMDDIFDAARKNPVIVDLIRFSGPFNTTGHPTITLPAGFTRAGRPIGMQLVARHGEEALLCRAGHAFQQATDWHRRHPLV